MMDKGLCVAFGKVSREDAAPNHPNNRCRQDGTRCLEQRKNTTKRKSKGKYKTFLRYFVNPMDIPATDFRGITIIPPIKNGKVHDSPAFTTHANDKADNR
jgi:hypothetical protein